jgi:hypothetical protein
MVETPTSVAFSTTRSSAPPFGHGLVERDLGFPPRPGRCELFQDVCLPTPTQRG